MSKRLDAIVNHWSNLAQYYGGANAKRYRGNLKRAATAAKDAADLFDRFEGDSRRVVQGDIETLRKAAALLSQLSSDFEVAQRKADRIREDALRKRAEEEKRQLASKIEELFGRQPDPDAVYGMAQDLYEFSQTGVDALARTKGCHRGLLSGEHNVHALDWEIRQKHLPACLRIIAITAIDSRYPGRVSRDRDEESWYHAGWPDFVAWRKAKMAAADKEPNTTS